MKIWSAEINEIAKLYESFEGHLPNLEKELEQLIRTHDANVALLYSRRSIEIIIIDLCECELKRPRKTEPLKGIIDKLNSEEKVPSHIIASMHSLNSMSSYGTHPRDFDQEQVKPVLNNLAIIIKWYLKYKDYQSISKSKDEEDTLESNHKKSSSLKTKIIFASIFILILVVLGYIFIPELSESSKPVEKSIAVLPFVNDSPDQENTYFINGLQDEILNNLQIIKSFTRVLSRTSTERYRGSVNPSIPKIAKDLDVKYIVEGSGQKYGSSYRIRVQLIAAHNESCIWAKSYEKEIHETKDIFDVQSEIAQSIAGELNATLTPEEKQSIEKTPTANLSAYDFYQQGEEEMKKYDRNKGNKSFLKKAEVLYKQSLKYDSAFAQAYIGLSKVYREKHYTGSYLSRNFIDSVLILANKAISCNDQLAEVYLIKAKFYNDKGELEQAIKQSNEALKYNPNCWEAYWLNGHIYLDYDLVDYVKVIENYQKALSLNNGNNTPDIFRGVGFFYSMYAGFRDKADYYFKEALKLDGDSTQYLNCIANGELWLTGNFQKAIELFNKSYAIDSGQIGNLRAIGLCYLFMRQGNEVLKYYKRFDDRAKALGDLNLIGNHRLGYGYWKTGNIKEAERCFSDQKKYCEESIKLRRFYSYTGSANYDLAGVYAFMGEKEKAYESLKLFNKPQICSCLWVTNINSDPMFDSIRNEPEFQQIIKSIASKYQSQHERVKKWLEEQGML